MKKLWLSLSFIVAISCAQKDNQTIILKSDSAKIIESINAVRTVINDSIRLKNNQSVFDDLSGKHQLKFSSDGDISMSGNINFEKTARDLYEVSGKAESGKNHLKINGTIKRVSRKHLNFEGTISQNINGENFTRTNNSTFFDEGKGNFWRLQDKINGSGFVDYIDIYF